MKNQLSDKALEWLNAEYSYTNPWFMNSQTVWEIFTKAKSGNKFAIEVWNNYRHKVKLPEIENVKFKTYGELVNKIYNNI